MDLRIREATPEDAAEIVSILNPIIEAGVYTVLEGPLTVEAEWERVKRWDRSYASSLGRRYHNPPDARGGRGRCAGLGRAGVRPLLPAIRGGQGSAVPHPRERAGLPGPQPGRLLRGRRRGIGGLYLQPTLGRRGLGWRS